MAVTQKDIKDWLSGRADHETMKRIAEDLEREDSCVDKVLKGMEEHTRNMLEDSLRGIGRQE